MIQDIEVHLTIAHSGREAVKHASVGTFDAIFMDMRMPEMDGLEATRRIRALGGHLAEIPIIALTANAFADDIQACRDAGMNDFIAKPLRKKMLIEKLANVVSSLPQRRKQAKPSAHDDLPIVAPAAVAMTDIGPVLDHTVLDALVEEIGIDGVRATLEDFVAGTEQQLKRLRAYSCDNDRREIKEEAHSLKGASGTFGLHSGLGAGADARTFSASDRAERLSRYGRPYRGLFRYGAHRAGNRNDRGCCIILCHGGRDCPLVARQDGIFVRTPRCAIGRA